MILALSLNVNPTLDRRSTIAAPPALLAPSGLTVAIAEASLAFGDTATANVSVSGWPEPTLAYQWTLDGADVAGRTGPTFAGAPTGALRVRVTATNSEGSAAVTSAPVTVRPLAPDAFSPGQWSADATGVSGEIAVALSGLPPANGAAILGVEYSAGGGAWRDFAALTSIAPWDDLTVARTWVSTQAAQDWSTTSEVSPFVIYQSPWGALDMAPGDVFNAELRADQTLSPAWPALRTITGPLQLGAGLPKGAPMIILGAHYDLTSNPNPFVTDGLRGVRSDAIGEWTAATRVRDRSEPDASRNVAVQTYATVAPTQVFGWNDQNTEQWFDIQVRHWWPNFPSPSETKLRGTVTLGGVEYKIYRNPTEGTIRPGAGTIGYGVIPTRPTLLARHDMKAIIDWIVADHNAVTAQSLPGLYIYQCAAWIEPRSGYVDATIEGLEVRFNGVTYGRLNRTEGGVAFDAPHIIGGLTDGVAADVSLRAVNRVGAGTESDVRAVAPYIAPAAPSGLTVAIAEASLSFGDTATASVSVSGNPAPTLDYQWTLDGVDVEGQTGSTFEGVPVGALRVRVTATNSEGVAGPVTSDPVTVAALAPEAFSAGQWTVDATGASGQVAITLFGLPPANGAAITSVERQIDGGSWIALAGVALNTPYTVTGLTDDQLYSFRLRAVNSVSAGPESAAQTVAPVAGTSLEYATNGGDSYLKKSVSIGADSAGFTFAIRAALVPNGTGNQRFFRVFQSHYVQISSTGALFVLLGSAPNVTAVTFLSSALIPSGQDAVLCVTYDAAAGVGSVTLDGAPLAGSWNTTFTGTFDHTAASMAFFASTDGSVMSSAANRWKWLYFSNDVRSPSEFGAAADHIDPATVGTPVVCFKSPADIVTGANSGSGGAFTVTGAGFAVLTPPPNVKTSPFPSALGAGAGTLGAYATTDAPAIRRVTSRAATGAGSFKAAVEDDVPAVVLFDVGGRLLMDGPIKIGSNKTVIGESAPEPVTFISAAPAWEHESDGATNDSLRIIGSEVILTGVRVRPAFSALADGIAIGKEGALPTNIVVAYNSVSWGGDENTSAWGGSENVTFQHNLIYEGLNPPPDPVTASDFVSIAHYIGSDGTAGNVDQVRVDTIRNMIATFSYRGTGYSRTRESVMAENIVYNYNNQAVVVYNDNTTGGLATLDILNNHFVAGPATGGNANRAMMFNEGTANNYFVSGNTTPLGNDYVLTGAEYLAPARVVTDGYAPTISALYDLEAEIGGRAGARMGGALDRTDARMWGQYLTNTAPTIKATHLEYDPLGLDATLGTAAREDTNGDGIYDAYEIAMGVAVGSLSPHTLIDHVTQGLGAEWGGYRQIVHQAHWLREVGPSTAADLWGAIAHGAEVSAAPLDAGAWTLDGATESALSAIAPYTAPRRVTGDQVWHRKNTTTSALSAAAAYPFAAVVKSGSSGAARIVFRHEASGNEARVLTADFTTVSVAYSTAAPGAITGAEIEALGDGFYRLSGVFTPNISDAFKFGVGPSGAGYVDLYGGAVALADEAVTLPPDPETVPAAFAPDQWELLDAGTNGTTLIVRILELPYDGGRPLTAIGYRLNGSGTTIVFPTIAPGDYQITVPSLTEASVLLRAVNVHGGVSSAAKVATPTAAVAPDPGPADALTRSNDIWEGKAALSVPSGQIISLGGVTLATSGETYINGVRLFNGDGSQWHVRRWGDLQYVPNGAHDALNADEFSDVSVTWRRTGDVSDRTFTIRVYGSQHTGNDLARGVTASTAMTLTQTVAAGEVLEVAFTAGASACTPSLGGVAGASCPAGKRDVQYLRSGGSAALTFTTTPGNVIARVLATPGDAASIRRIKASRSGSTLSLDWRTMPRSGFPNTSGWTEGGGTPSAPEVRNRALSAAGFQTATGSWTQWKYFSGATTKAFLHDAVITGVNSVAKLRNGFTNFLMYDVEGYGPVYQLKDAQQKFVAGSQNPDRGQLLVPLENTSTWPDQGVLQIYDTVFDFKVSTGNNEALDGDAYIRNMLIKLYFMNGDWRNTGDAISDMKGAAQFHCMTYGASWRAIRAWHHATLYGRTRLDGPYTQAVLNQSERGGIIALWMVDQPGGLRVRDQAEVPTTTNLSAFNYVADKRQTIVMKSKPAFAPECDYAATDFEFEQSLNGGASWSPLSVERTGPNDCWGATRRTITGVSTSITHVRARAHWGAKVGAWTQAAVTA